MNGKAAVDMNIWEYSVGIGITDTQAVVYIKLNRLAFLRRGSCGRR